MPSEFTSEGFRASSSAEAGQITGHLLGEADYRAVETVDAFLRHLHQEAQRADARDVVVDLRELAFMNSACFKCFVTWLRRLDAVQGTGYQIRFIANPDTHWLQASLSALQAFALGRVTVTAE